MVIIRGESLKDTDIIMIKFKKYLQTVGDARVSLDIENKDYYYITQ